MPLLDKLNPQQRAAAETVKGPVLIFAGAGSGKTRTLTYRLAHMVRDCNIAPHSILAVTFTNKAANEMKQRIERLIGEDARRLWAGTFHSVCARILRADGSAIGIQPNFTIYDENDQKAMVKEALSILDVDIKQYSPADVHYAISDAKNELMDIAQFRRDRKGPFDDVARRAYAVYQQRLRDNNALDFDDLLMRTVELFERSEEVLAKYQQRFGYVLVDEYQDINQAQYRFVQLLAQGHRNICVVGDDDQSIYGWRGANVGIILAFAQDWPDAKVIKLEQNYRSTQKILECAYEVIKHNKARAPKHLWTENQEGDNIVCYEAVNEDEEADWVATLIGSKAACGQATWGEWAILYRTNAMSRAFEDAMMKASIPYRIVGGLRYYDRSEIRDIIAYLRVVCNSSDGIAMRRIINNPPRGIGDRTLSVVDRLAHTRGSSLFDALEGASQDEELRPVARQSLRAFNELISRFRKAAEELPLTDLVRNVVEQSGLLEKLRNSADADDASRAENLEEFVTTARRFEDTNDTANLEGFLEHLALISDLDQAKEEGNSVSLMTLHSSKGLEFPHVIMVGLEEGIFPHERSMGDEFELEEERRLCYVGITRARRRLYMTHAHRRTIYGATRNQTPSRFLADLPEALVDRDATLSNRPHLGLFSADDIAEERVVGGRKIDLQSLLSRAQANAHTARQRREETVEADQKASATAVAKARSRKAPKKAEAQPESVDSYRPGEKVTHAKFGKGIVVSIKGEGPDAELAVAFRGAGVKKLKAQYAKLTKD